MPQVEKRLGHRCFPVNFAKFLRPAFLAEHLWELLLWGLQNLQIEIPFLMPNKKDPELTHRESIFIRRQHKSFWFSPDPVKLTAKSCSR